MQPVLLLLRLPRELALLFLVLLLPQPLLKVQLVMRLANGSQVRLSTSADGAGGLAWAAASGPVTFDSLYDGETFDGARAAALAGHSEAAGETQGASLSSSTTKVTLISLGEPVSERRSCCGVVATLLFPGSGFLLRLTFGRLLLSLAIQSILLSLEIRCASGLL